MKLGKGTPIAWIAFGLFAGCLLLLVLVVNGAVPGFMAPTTGQLIWTTGFSQSFANNLSLHAREFGLPEPAAISFGLAAALPIALFLKLGLPPADAYSTAFAIWFAVGFWGAHRFVRLIGGSSAMSLLCALLWLTSPIVWQHSGYSMVSLGFALLPAYFYSALRLLSFDRGVPSLVLFLAAALVAVFMDGYSFMMFATGTGALLVSLYVSNPEQRQGLLYRGFPIVSIGFAASYAAYAAYIGRPNFTPSSIDFFRGWGVNIEFLFVPTKGLMLLPDLLGMSVPRHGGQYFGDSSVFISTFSLVLILGAGYASLANKANRTLKVALVLIAIGGFYMALGPSFKLFVEKPEGVGPLMPLHFAPWRTGTEILSAYLPGFNNMRASYRWVALGMFGAWALIALLAANRNKQSRVVVAFVLTGIMFNIPTAAMVGAYADNRRMIDDIDHYVESLRPAFRPEERVAFLPYRNDFFANFIASKLDIRTYNIGGDKNLAAAMAHWPERMRAFKQGEADPDFSWKVLALLADDDVDTVAIPYIDLLGAPHGWHGWPAKEIHHDEMRPHLQALEQSGLVDISQAEHLALVRLTLEIRQKTREERLVILSHEQWKYRDAIRRTRFKPGDLTQVGRIVEGVIESTGKAGYLVYGPYLPLRAGRYRLKIFGNSGETRGAYADVVSAKGKTNHAKFPLFSTGGRNGTLAEGEVTLPANVEDVELRVFVNAESDVALIGYEMEAR